MRAIEENRGSLIILLVVFSQLFSFCSRRLHPEVSGGPSARGIVKPAERPRAEIQSPEISPGTPDAEVNPVIDVDDEMTELKAFMEAGAEKRVDTRMTSADRIIETAQTFLGVPHCMGGTSRKCIDCSGLVMLVFAEHGIELPHNSQEQARYGKIIRHRGDLTRGDLVFFTRSYNAGKFITHAGIYLGDNKFIHTSSGKGVTITSLDDKYWKARFVFGTRLLD